AQAAIEVLNAGVVVRVGAAPLLHDGAQRGQVGVVMGVPADQDGAAAAGPERVGPEAADQQVPAAAAVEDVVPRSADQDVVGDAAAGVEGVVAVAAEEEGRYGQAAGQLERATSVDEQVAEGGPAGGGIAPDGIK